MHSQEFLDLPWDPITKIAITFAAIAIALFYTSKLLEEFFKHLYSILRVLLIVVVILALVRHYGINVDSLRSAWTSKEAAADSFWDKTHWLTLKVKQLF